VQGKGEGKVKRAEISKGDVGRCLIDGLPQLWREMWYGMRCALKYDLKGGVKCGVVCTLV
jgi:hypothetical protein